MMSMTENGSAWSGNNPVEDSAIEQQLRPVKKKRLHRHSTHQIQEMEAYVFSLPFKKKKLLNNDD